MSSSSTPASPSEILYTRFVLEQQQGGHEDLDAWLQRQPETQADLALRQEVLRLHAQRWRALSVLGKPGSRGGRHQPGEQIGEDFELRSLLGEGGMGEVWEARQKSLDRLVALKLILPKLFDSDHLERFSREARAGARLSHPGIVMTLGGHAEAESAWIALELVPGKRTLREFIAERRLPDSLPEGHDREVAELVAEIADALHFAHQNGIIHRDIKPRNILLTPSGHPKVSDFGLAQILDETLTHGDVGTDAYMSPEQVAANKAAIDHRTDIFSLGVVLYELLTLQKPFVGDTNAQVRAKILLRDPPDPRTLRSRLPTDLAVIVGKALEKERNKRYQTMVELGADLRRHLSNEPIHATPPTRLDRAVKWTKRNPGKSSAAAIVAVTFTVIALLSVALSFKSQESEQRRVAAEQSAQREKDAAELAKTNERIATGRVDDVLRLSALQNLEDMTTEGDHLWPAHPENIARYETWLVRAEALMAELPGHKKKLAELRSKSVPWTEEEQAKHRAEHPKLAELERAQRELEYWTRLGSVLESGAPGEEPTAAEVGVDLSSLPTSAEDVEWLAFRLIDPKRKDFGGERKGLLLARRAVELASTLAPAERAGIRHLLARALFVNGRSDEAVAEEERARDEAAPDKKQDFEDYVLKLRAASEAAMAPEQEAQREKHRTDLEGRIAALEAEISERSEWVFSDAQDKWWHNQLEKLVNGLTAFADEKTGLFSEGTSEEHGWGMKKRLANALLLRAGFSPEGEHALAWSAALPEIRAAYPGLSITPQLGLLPIGRDPKSGLWEFAHLQTGEPAERGADGKLVLTEATGLVFVLLPAGIFPMGAQKSDSKGTNYDPQAFVDEGPVQAVTLSAFFLSKYEMTQGQWERFVGRNPSDIAPGSTLGGKKTTFVNPVEQVSWLGCKEVMDRLGLSLPSEAQWEYGARGGTRTVWWTGNERESLVGVANLADQAAQRDGQTWQDTRDWPELDDGYVGHAPVNAFLPNAFGLHNVHGNVCEWCLDGYRGSFNRQGWTKDPVSPPEGSSERVARGGSFRLAASFARSAVRSRGTPLLADNSLGLRPARTIAP